MQINKMRAMYSTKNLFFLLFACLVFQACKGSDDPIKKTETDKDVITTIIPSSSITKKMVFNAGDNGIHSYRIPTLVTTKNGSLLLFAEARKTTWRDKSPTDIVVKRSADNGQNWSAMTLLTSGGNNAYMDPTALVDHTTGRIFLFCTLVPSTDQTGPSNTAWVITSDDDGLTWSAPRNVTSEIIAPGFYNSGFAPGSGLQMKGTTYKDRLILPVRQSDATRTRNRAVYSDDHGATWKIGNEALDGGEWQIAESPLNTLINNRRGDGKRYKAKSTNGGLSWAAFTEDSQLRTVSGGCQGSILGIDKVLFYTGPVGGPESETMDNRGNLMIYRSFNGGDTWTKQFLLYDKAASYSCITQLKDGRLAIVFESADTPTFPKAATRPAGWIRLDVLILPKEVVLEDHWFTK
ncbi:sialidase family protein [Pedobacter sp.]